MARESKKRQIERAAAILDELEQHFPDATTALEHSTPWELLVATILSAQCTDERVNQVTRELFPRYPSIETFAAADLATLQQEIRATGFYQKKGKAVVATAQAVLEDFGGELPATMEELLRLPGVARKTANVVLAAGFGRAEGIIVDTHVARLALRMGLASRQEAKTLNTDRIERELMALIPQERWIFTGLGLVLHGRTRCTARKPACDACPVRSLCPRLGVS